MKSTSALRLVIGKVLPYLLLLAYIFLNFILLLKHEPWRDEAQHWLIARDLSPFEIINQMRYEGHLCLWNLILAPFAKAGFPYITTNLISLSIMSATTAIFIFRAPFKIWAKTILIFSPLFTYYYPVISRNYCLIPPFILLLALVYPHRHKKPLRYGLLIALLLQTHIIMLGMAAALSILWLIEAIKTYQKNGEKKELTAQARGLCLPLLSLLFLIFQLYSVPVSSVPESNINGLVNINIINPFFTPIFYSTLSWCLSSLFFCRSYFSSLCLILIFSLIVIGIKKYHSKITTMLIILFSSLLYQLLIYAFVYESSIQRIITWGYIILFCLLIQTEETKEPKFSRISTAILVLISLSLSYNFGPTILRDYSYPYSDSKHCAAFINDNLPENALLLTNLDFSASSLIPYLNHRQILNPSLQNSFSFVRWDKERLQHTTKKEIIEWLKDEYPEYDNFYLIYVEDRKSKLYPEDMLNNKNLVYKTEVDPLIMDERYYIFKVPIS